MIPALQALLRMGAVNCHSDRREESQTLLQDEMSRLVGYQLKPRQRNLFSVRSSAISKELNADG